MKIPEKHKSLENWLVNNHDLHPMLNVFESQMVRLNADFFSTFATWWFNRGYVYNATLDDFRQLCNEESSALFIGNVNEQQPQQQQQQQVQPQPQTQQVHVESRAESHVGSPKQTPQQMNASLSYYEILDRTAAKIPPPSGLDDQMDIAPQPICQVRENDNENDKNKEKNENIENKDDIEIDEMEKGFEVECWF